MTIALTTSGEQQTITTVTRDSTTLLLDGISLSKDGYIELYDSNPFKKADDHFVAKYYMTLIVNSKYIY